MRQVLRERVAGRQHQWRAQRTYVPAHQLSTVRLGRGGRAEGPEPGWEDHLPYQGAGTRPLGPWATGKEFVRGKVVFPD